MNWKRDSYLWAFRLRAAASECLAGRLYKASDNQLLKRAMGGHEEKKEKKVHLYQRAPCRMHSNMCVCMDVRTVLVYRVLKRKWEKVPSIFEQP